MRPRTRRLSVVVGGVAMIAGAVAMALSTWRNADIVPSALLVLTGAVLLACLVVSTPRE